MRKIIPIKMGQYLPKPCTLVDIEKSESENIDVAVGSMQGWRVHMEDAHIARIGVTNDTTTTTQAVAAAAVVHNDISLFAVFDGHGGKEVAHFAQEYYESTLVQTAEFQQGNYEAALRHSFHKIDELLEDIKYDELLKTYKKLPNPSTINVETLTNFKPLSSLHMNNNTTSTTTAAATATDVSYSNTLTVSSKSNGTTIVTTNSIKESGNHHGMLFATDHKVSADTISTHSLPSDNNVQTPDIQITRSNNDTLYLKKDTTNDSLTKNCTIGSNDSTMLSSSLSSSSSSVLLSVSSIDRDNSLLFNSSNGNHYNTETSLTGNIPPNNIPENAPISTTTTTTNNNNISNSNNDNNNDIIVNDTDNNIASTSSIDNAVAHTNIIKLSLPLSLSSSSSVDTTTTTTTTNPILSLSPSLLQLSSSSSSSLLSPSSPAVVTTESYRTMVKILHSNDDPLGLKKVKFFNNIMTNIYEKNTIKKVNGIVNTGLKLSTASVSSSAMAQAIQLSLQETPPCSPAPSLYNTDSLLSPVTHNNNNNNNNSATIPITIINATIPITTTTNSTSYFNNTDIQSIINDNDNDISLTLLTNTNHDADTHYHHHHKTDNIIVQEVSQLLESLSLQTDRNILTSSSSSALSSTSQYGHTETNGLDITIDSNIVKHHHSNITAATTTTETNLDSNNTIRQDEQILHVHSTYDDVNHTYKVDSSGSKSTLEEDEATIMKVLETTLHEVTVPTTATANTTTTGTGKMRITPPSPHQKKRHYSLHSTKSQRTIVIENDSSDGDISSSSSSSSSNSSDEGINDDYTSREDENGEDIYEGIQIDSSDNTNYNHSSGMKVDINNNKENEDDDDEDEVFSPAKELTIDDVSRLWSEDNYISLSDTTSHITATLTALTTANNNNNNNSSHSHSGNSCSSSNSNSSSSSYRDMTPPVSLLSDISENNVVDSKDNTNTDEKDINSKMTPTNVYDLSNIIDTNTNTEIIDDKLPLIGAVISSNNNNIHVDTTITKSITSTSQNSSQSMSTTSEEPLLLQKFLNGLNEIFNPSKEKIDERSKELINKQVHNEQNNCSSISQSNRIQSSSSSLLSSSSPIINISSISTHEISINTSTTTANTSNTSNNNNDGSSSNSSNNDSKDDSKDDATVLTPIFIPTQDKVTLTTTNNTKGNTATAKSTSVSTTKTTTTNECKLSNHRINAGCTANVILKVKNTLYIANAGDSRAVLCRGDNSALPLSIDHKPNDDREKNRVIAAGGFVTIFGRINGNLNLSRSLGDLKYKQNKNIPPEAQIITAEPDVTIIELLPDDQFLLLGCDGIWDCLSCQMACDLVSERLARNMPIDKIVTEILEGILATDTVQSRGVGTDNMTFMIVHFKPKIISEKKIFPSVVVDNNVTTSVSMSQSQSGSNIVSNTIQSTNTISHSDKRPPLPEYRITI